MSSILEQKNISNYRNKIKNTIKLISFDNFKPQIKGTAGLKSQRYSVDIDLFSVIDYNNKDIKEVKREIRKEFYQIFKRLKNKDNIFFIDFKGGINPYLYQNFKTIKQIKEFYKNRKEQIPKEQYKKLLKLKGLSEVQDFGRKIYTLKWSLDELNKGKKTLPNGDIIKFDEILDDGTVIKIDILAIIDSIFWDITQIYEFWNRGEPLFFNKTKLGEGIEESFKKELKDKNYTKALKRLFSLARFKKDYPLIKKLTDIFNSNIGLVYKIYNNFDLLSTVFEKLDKKQIKNILEKMKDFIQINKELLGNVWDFNIPNKVFQLIEEITNSNSLISIENKISKIYNLLKETTNKETKKIMETGKINYKSYIN